MTEELNKFNNEIGDLPKLDEYSYENIFKVYREENHYVYNLLSKINIPADIDESIVNLIRIDGPISWTNLSYKYYGTIKLWWLICIVNGIKNPVYLPKTGAVFKIIKPAYVRTVLDEIKKDVSKR